MRALYRSLGLCVLSVWAVAQPVEKPIEKPFQYRGNFYGMVNGGLCIHVAPFISGGGGGEALVFKGLSVGGEGSYGSFSDGWSMGFLSGQVGYHFGSRTKRTGMDPFVSFGVGGAFLAQGRTEPSINFGGGATYWVKERVGVRFEGRVQGVGYSDGIFLGRVGVSFR